MTASAFHQTKCLNCGAKIELIAKTGFCKDDCARDFNAEIEMEDKREKARETEEGEHHEKQPSDSWEARTWSI